MIWATVSSQSCFCWLYRASPFLAAKNIISLNLVLTIWWCSCVESSLVLLEESVCYDQCVLLGRTLLALPCFILYSKAKFACYSRCFLTSYFCIPVPCNEKDILASGPITSWEIDVETWSDFNFGGSKITADGDCSHEIRRCLLLGRKVMTNLDSILKSRDITLSTKSI